MIMTNEWYPRTVKVKPEGVAKTYRFMESVFQPAQKFCYAEFGIYLGGTAENVCEIFPNSTLYLFDFHERVEDAKTRLAKYDNRIYYFGNTQKFNDSYNWSLINILSEFNGERIFDYCFLDGAHTFSVDALNYFLCDLLLKPGGYLDFDDYSWKLRGSSLDPGKVPEISLQYTDEQIDTQQVKLIVDELVRRNPNYEEVMKDKVFRKIT